jgi:hypothetical protein
VLNSFHMTTSFELKLRIPPSGSCGRPARCIIGRNFVKNALHILILICKINWILHKPTD